MIGVPLQSSKSVGDGMDALLSSSRCRPAFRLPASRSTARNAAILAARILAQGGGLPASEV